MGRTLTEEMLLEKNNVDSVARIIDLNCWAMDLDNVEIVKDIPRVETMSLSLNMISSLKPFQDCPNLRELYLRKNKIASLSEIQHLRTLTNLKVLWLWDNPCCEHPHYRSYIIKLLPSLEKLDNQCVTTEERLNARKLTEAQMTECEEVRMGDVDERKGSEGSAVVCKTSAI